MTYEQKRQYVYNLYSGPKWKKQVDQMPDDQIIAIYMKHLNAGQMPEHETIGEVEIESLINLPENPRPPHENEDEFEIY